MQNQNNKELENMFHQCLSWIKSIENPLFKNYSNINDLKDGKVFLELLKYYYDNNKENQNYYSLINRANNAENPFERMNIIFHTITKIINNNKIKSRIEVFHNNINEFLKNDNLIMELFIFIIYFLFRKNKNNNRTSRMSKQENINNSPKRNKNHSCSQIEKEKNLLNIDDNKYQRKIISYDSVNKKDKSNNNERNNFLFYINNKNENIINIDNIINFKFTNEINDLKVQNNNVNNNHISKEIKTYVTKPKIIKYQTQYFNYIKDNKNHKNNKSNINIRNTKSKINFNDLKNFIKNEENKINAAIAKIKNSINNRHIINNHHIYKPENYDQNLNEDNDEKGNKLILENEDKSKFEKELEDEKYSFEKNDMNLFHKNRNLSANNYSEKNDIYKLLKLSKNNNIKNVDNEKFIEEKKVEKQLDNLNEFSEERIKNHKKKYHSRNFRRNKSNERIEQHLLKDTIEFVKKKDIKRQTSYPINKLNSIKRIYQFNEDNNINNNKRAHSLLKYKYPKNMVANNNKNDKEKIFNWLINLKVIKLGETNLVNLPQLISDGKLLCDIINKCENKDYQVIEVLNEISIKENVLININNALKFLNKIDNFPKRNIIDYEPIFEIDTDIIWGLLLDLYNYYSNKVDIKNNFQEKYNEPISINNNDFNISEKKENLPSKRRKKYSSEKTSLNFNNNIKRKNNFNKNINIKNNLIENVSNERNDSENFNNNYSKIENNENQDSNYPKYINDLTIDINHRENIKRNNSSKNIYNQNKIKYIKSGNSNEKNHNYLYYINALQNYFDQGKNSQGINSKNANSKMKNENVSHYSYFKYF